MCEYYLEYHRKTWVKKVTFMYLFIFLTKSSYYSKCGIYNSFGEYTYAFHFSFYFIIFFFSDEFGAKVFHKFEEERGAHAVDMEIVS